MLNSKRSRNAAVMGLLVLLVLGTGLQGQSSAKPGGDQLLEMVPAESLFCIRVNNFEYTLSQIDQFIAGVSPMPMGISILVRMQLANVLGSPELNGVNMNGSLVIFGAILPGEQTQTNPVSNVFIGGLVPVTDYRQLISGNPNCSQPDEKGVSKITSNGTPIMLVAQAGNYALISWANGYAKLVAMAKVMSATGTAGLASTLDAAEAKLAMTEPIWVYGNVQQASRSFGNLVFEKIEDIKTNLKNIKAKDSNTPPMMNIESIMNMYASIFQTLMKETGSVSLTLRPKPTALNLKVGVSAVSGTDMANMFVADTSANQKNKLLGYLEDGAIMNVGFKANTPFLKKLNDKRFDLLSVITGESITAEDTAKLKILATDMVDSLGGSAAFSFSIDDKNKPPFAIKYVIEIEDAEKFDKVIKESIEMMNTSGIMDFYKSFGLEMSFAIKRGIERYKGVSIDSAKLVMKSTDPNSPQGLMMNTMFRDGFDYRWGIVNGLWVCAVSSDPDSAIRELIDEVKAGGPTQMSDEIKTALTLLPEAEKADFVATYNYLRLFKMVGAIVPLPMPMLQMDIPTKSNIVLAGKAGNGKMVVDIALPKEHLMEIMRAFQTIQQQMMMPQKQQNKPSSPRSSSVESIPETDLTWVKCANTDCKAAYQMGKRAYFKYIEEHADPMSPSAPALVCKKCGKESIYRAEKCGNPDCRIAFLRGSVPNDFADRCPECGNSNTEEIRKRRRKTASVKPVPPTAGKDVKFVIPKKNLQIPEEMQTCAANFRKIQAAIKKYEKDKGELPNWLSDLVPDHITNDALLCSNDPRHKAKYSPDPKLPCSYAWEFSSARIPSGWDPTRRTLYRDWKTQQVRLFGDVVPMVRCHHHGSNRVLNLSTAGQIYWGKLDWEKMFKPDYRFGDESPERQRRVIQPAGQLRIAGVVRDEIDKPLEGVKLAVLPMSRGEVTSDSQGRFEVRWDPRRLGSRETVHYLVARLEERHLAAAVEIDEETKTLDVKLKPGVVFAGKVVDLDGKGISNARIMIMLRVSNWSSSLGRGQVADVEGKFEVRALPLGHKYSLTARAEGYGEKRIEVHTNDAVDNHLDVGRLTLAVADLSVSGLVVDVDDKPVANARVYCYGEGQQHSSAQTDTDGKFTLEKICEGQIRIMASVSGKTRLYGYIQTEGGATDVKVVISERPSATRYIPKPPPSLGGKAAPDFTLRDLNGKQVSLSDFKGKVVLLDFWATWCPPCVRAIPHIEALHKKYKDQGLVVIGINHERDHAKVKAFAKGQISYIILLDADEQFTEYGVTGIPTAFYIDKEGKIRYRDVGFGPGKEKEIEQKVKELLAGKKESTRVVVPVRKALKEEAKVLAFDDFDGKLNLDWDILHVDTSHVSLTKKPGTLMITTQRGGLSRSSNDYKNLFLIDCATGASEDFQITTHISSFKPVANWNQAGLIFYNDDDNYLKWVYEWADHPRFTIIGETNGRRMTSRWINAPAHLEEIYLRITKRGSGYTFWTSLDGKSFHRRGRFKWGDGRVKWVGLLAINGMPPRATALEVDASFDFFEVRAVPAEPGEAGAAPTPPPKGRGCFLAYTPVWVNGALVKISKVVLGQTVGKLRHAALTACLAQVEKLEEHVSTFECRDIVLESGNRISVVDAHCFMLDSGQWIAVQDLRNGLRLKTLNGTVGIKSVITRAMPFVGKVYNLKVKSSDRYLVGEDAVIVRDY